MREVSKRFFPALLLMLVVWSGAEAAPRKSESSGQDVSQIEGRDDGDQAQAKSSDHIHYLSPNVEYETHIHEYPHKPPTPQLYKNTMLDALKYLDDTFHFIRVVNKDEALATDVVDESWHKWFSHLMPIISKYAVDANNIENPANDAPNPLWDQILNVFLKSINVTEADYTDVNGDGVYDNDLNVQYSKVKFDPLGKLAQAAWKSVRRYTGFNWVSTWWERVKKEFQEYLANPQEALVTEVADDKEGGGGGGVVAFPLPAGVLSISKYDPVSLGVNAILNIIFHSVFWASYLPYSGVENLFYDYYDEYYDDDYPDDYPDDEDAPPEDGGDEPPEEGGDEPPEEGEAPPEEGEGDDTNRIDSYTHYNYDPNYYAYYDQFYKRSSHVAPQRDSQAPSKVRSLVAPNRFGGDRLDYGMPSRYGG